MRCCLDGGKSLNQNLFGEKPICGRLLAYLRRPVLLTRGWLHSRARLQKGLRDEDEYPFFVVLKAKVRVRCLAFPFGRDAYDWGVALTRRASLKEVRQRIVDLVVVVVVVVQIGGCPTRRPGLRIPGVGGINKRRLLPRSTAAGRFNRGGRIRLPKDAFCRWTR